MPFPILPSPHGRAYCDGTELGKRRRICSTLGIGVFPIAESRFCSDNAPALRLLEHFPEPQMPPIVITTTTSNAVMQIVLFPCILVSEILD